MVPNQHDDPNNMRIPNTTRSGEPFDHTTIRSVWEKARKQPGFETFSLDHRGTSISMFEYGRRSPYGWIIEHIVPYREGGTDDISNLRPLHWKHTGLGPDGTGDRAPR